MDGLLDFLGKRMTLRPVDVELVRAVTRPYRAKRGEVLQRAGDVARFGVFVSSGCIRSYVIDERGKEYVLQFAPEGWWLTDLESLTSGVPAAFFIEALEDSDLVLMDPVGHQRFLAELPGYAAAFTTGLQKMSAARERRVLTAISATAEERYARFMETYPSIALRVPQHMLASYLGITPETLSRVRSRLAKRRSRPAPSKRPPSR